jgi:flagellar biosynthetic protein FliR
MHFSEVELLELLARFLWPFLRIGALFVAMPILSSHNIPLRVRILLAAGVTVAVVPTLPPPPAIDMFGVGGFLIGAQQIILGTLVGWAVHLIFGAIVFGGQNIAYNMGLGFASMVDPQTGVQVPVIAQLYMILSTLLFLSMDAHLLLIQMIAESFHAIPVDMKGLGADRLWTLCLWSSRLFAAGVLMSLPIVTALLLVNLGFGVASRAAPQLNIFSVGFPVTLLLGVLLIWIGLPGLMELFGQFLEEGYGVIKGILT